MGNICNVGNIARMDNKEPEYHEFSEYQDNSSRVRFLYKNYISLVIIYLYVGYFCHQYKSFEQNIIIALLLYV